MHFNGQLGGCSSAGWRCGRRPSPGRLWLVAVAPVVVHVRQDPGRGPQEAHGHDGERDDLFLRRGETRMALSQPQGVCGNVSAVRVEHGPKITFTFF